jgi:hypothetical protein
MNPKAKTFTKKKLNPKAKTFTKKKLNPKAKTFSFKKGGKNKVNSKVKTYTYKKGGKYNNVKKSKKVKGGWVGTAVSTAAGLGIGYGIGIGLPGKIKDKFSQMNNNSDKIIETGDDGFNKVEEPKPNTSEQNKSDVKTGGSKCSSSEHYHPSHPKAKKNGCMKNSDMGGSKKSKKKMKTKGKKSAYSQFLSKELKKVGDAHPDWPQPKVFSQAVSNWSNMK